ncbi:WXG100 family type VII secretion target [Nonomuraea sp. NN258]|uniref:WXG100 family type VII secretion target n=1 Tax=Nonomuraea antri TaxID=2730852 RepID=UPI001569B4EA|nr:WXG100 family type VII secretion target [Nonomuraea antri]NRQ39075.1 WXG100 family type VII secretion target [Nonomuraea antri]
MSYEADKAIYLTAAGLAVTAAFMIRQKWAFYVAAAIGLMVADPGGMSNSAMIWRTTDQGGSTAELDELDRSLDRLKDRLKEEGKWDGQAFDTFAGVHETFKKSLKTLKETRNDTGQAVDQTAAVYHYGAYVCLAVASAMMVLGVIRLASSFNPFTAAASEVATAAAGAATTQTVRQMLMKQGKLVAILATILYMVVQQTEAMGKIFPTLKAMPTPMSVGGASTEFAGAGLQYDEKTGSLMPKMDESLMNGQYPGGTANL